VQSNAHSARTCPTPRNRRYRRDDSGVSRLLTENKSFRMHEEAGTAPGFYYLWDHEAP
jgi:hypothetical protein